MTTFAAITLTAPLMLLGMTGVALPIAAHLLQRRATRQIVFPTVRLLHDALGGRARLSRLRRLLLLSLRCMGMALLVAAFAQPVWFRPGTPPPTPRESVGLVLVLDNSASSGQTLGGVSLLHALRAAARRALSELQADTDVANFILASPTPQAVFPQLSRNLDALQQELDSLIPAWTRADLAGAIALAGEQLQHHPGPRRIVVLSDMQASDWAELAHPQPLPASVALSVLPVGAGQAANLALAAPRAMLAAQPVAGQPLPLAVRLTNHAPAAAVTQIQLQLDGQPAAFENVSLDAGASRDIAFEVKLPAPGWHTAVFTLPPDNLQADNTAYLALRAMGRLGVTLVSDDDSDQPGSGAYFLTRALTPQPESSDLALRFLHGSQLDDAALAQTQILFMDRVEPLSAAALAGVVDFVRRGGALAIFCGPDQNPATLQALQGALENSGGLPWLPASAFPHELPQAGQSIRDGVWDAPLLRDFDERSRLALAQVRFSRAWPVKNLRPDAAVLLRLPGGEPALAMRQIGYGRLLLANFSPAASASDLGKHGIFVALMQSLVENLRPRQDNSAQTLAGQALHFPLDSPGSAADAWAVLAPDGRRLPVLLSAAGPLLTASLPRAEKPGVYRLVRGEEVRSALAVNLDPRESDLRRADAAAVAATFKRGQTAADVIAAGSRDTDALQLRGKPLWPWLVMAAMAALGVELLLLAWWKE